MTSPKHAQDTNRGRYYIHPESGDRLVSVTNVLSTAVGKPALVPWAAKVAAVYAIDNLPTLVRRLRTDDPEDVRKEISSQVGVSRDKAADLGTRIHAHADAHVTGRAIADDGEVKPYLGQYLRFLDEWGIDLEHDVEAAELTVADPASGYAGTMDLRVRLPLKGFLDGKTIWVDDPTDHAQWMPWTVDLKTSATRARGDGYPEYVLQLAALRYAKQMWLPDDTTARLLPSAGGAVLNLRKGGYALIPVDANPPAHRAFLALLEGTKWLHARDRFEPIVEHPNTKTPTRKRAARKAA